MLTSITKPEQRDGSFLPDKFLNHEKIHFLISDYFQSAFIVDGPNTQCHQLPGFD